MTFTYSQLNREASEIRLVRFKEPASADSDPSPIELELRSASLDDDVHYAALSYAWGRPDASTAAHIHINGGSVTIGRTVSIALTQLRQNGIRSWLWIDSICINQPDLEEKTWQVEQMHSIFTRAAHVYVWLGLGSYKTDKAMDFVSRLGPRALAVGVLDIWANLHLESRVFQYIKDQTSSTEVSQWHGEVSLAEKELADFIVEVYHEPDLRSAPIEAETGFQPPSLVMGIDDIMRRDYWHRIWVIQEMALAQEATILCGEKAVQLEHFDAVFSAIHHCRQLGVWPENPDVVIELFPNFYDSTPINTRRKHRHHENITIYKIVNHRGAPPGRPYYSTTDARDIVFGLLGVVTDGAALGLRVDYTMTLTEVFTALTRALLYDGEEHPRRYHIDRCVPRQDGDLSLDSLPSWVPDWSAIGQHGFKVWPVKDNGWCNATAGAPTPPRSGNASEGKGSGCLRRAGCRVDVITEVMPPPPWKYSVYGGLPDLQTEDVDGWLASVRDFTRLGVEPSPGEDYVWRTLMMDHYTDSSWPNEDEAKPIDNSEKAALIRKIMRRMAIDIKTLTEAQREFVRRQSLIREWFQPRSEFNLEHSFQDLWASLPLQTASAGRGRTLFKTTKGMFGLGHVAIRPGDVVSLLWGVCSPIVLRPRCDRDGGGFSFVGDAYVDGIMNGEFLKTMPEHTVFDIY